MMSRKIWVAGKFYDFSHCVMCCLTCTFFVITSSCLFLNQPIFIPTSLGKMWQDFWISDFDHCSSTCDHGCFEYDDLNDLILQDDYDSESTWSADQDFVSASDSLSTITLTSNCTCRYSTSRSHRFQPSTTFRTYLCVY